MFMKHFSLIKRCRNEKYTKLHRLHVQVCNSCHVTKGALIQHFRIVSTKTGTCNVLNSAQFSFPYLFVDEQCSHKIVHISCMPCTINQLSRITTHLDTVICKLLCILQFMSIEYQYVFLKLVFCLQFHYLWLS